MEQHSIACRCTVEYAVECGRIASTIVQESLLARRAKRDKRRCSCATRAKTLTPWCDTSKDSHTMSDWHLFGVLHWHLFGVLHVDACYYIYIHACVSRVACHTCLRVACRVSERQDMPVQFLCDHIQGDRALRLHIFLDITIN